MSLEKIKSSANEEILTRQGRLLCSPRDAAAEACAWVEKYKDLFESANSVGVIGAGAGFHVLELEKRYPEKNILVFDLDSDLGLIQMPFKSRMIINADTDIIRKKNQNFFRDWPVLVPFRPAFQPLEKEYVNLWINLAERTQAVENKLVNSKGYESQEEAKIWLCLRELVR